MSHSTAKGSRKKASKPSKHSKDFPLFPHTSGLWCKKIKGEHKYFGVWSDPDAALKRYNDFIAGKSTDGLTVKALVNSFLDAKEAKMKSGEMSPRSFRDYHRTCSGLVEFFGRPQLVEDLRPEDFGRLRSHLSHTRGAVSLGNEVIRCRSVFRFASENDLIPKPVKYGTYFAKPDRNAVRRAKVKRGRMTFEAAEIRKLLDKANPVMKAMILLGINAAYGQSDIASLPQNAVNLKTGWLDYARQKTGIERKIPLWPETIESLKAAIAARPKPLESDDDALVFVTKHGRPWVRTKLNAKEEIIALDSILPEFQKLIDSVKGVARLGFYSLRHTHRTVADGVKDQPACNAIMGHVDETMAGNYRHDIEEHRLRAVTNHVRKWLFPPRRAAK